MALVDDCLGWHEVVGDEVGQPPGDELDRWAGGDETGRVGATIGGAHDVAECSRHGVDGLTRAVWELAAQLHGQLSADSHVGDDGDEPADGCQFVRREDAVGDFVYDVLAVDVGGIQVGHVACPLVLIWRMPNSLRAA